MFAGLMSRCTMAVRWAASKASATARDVDQNGELDRAARELLLERFPVQALHRDEGRIDADIVDRTDMGMVEGGRGPPLAREWFQGLRRPGVLVRQPLNGHQPLEPRVPRPVDLSHPAD